MKLQVVWVVLAMFSGATLTFAQDHSQHQMSATEQVGEPEHIFCPTMKTGQLCTHGTAANLGLTGEKMEEWRAIARVYNQRVNAATEQLFLDAEATLTPEKVALLKAWFAVGLNPEINEILYGKGLYGEAAAASLPSDKD
jgi:predicted transglutaminase-like cysteine proteinase